MWDPGQYGKFGDHRSRPFFELTGRIGAEAPEYVVDLGCGSGELTAAIASRWPSAVVEGFDTSPEMIEAAKAWSEPSGRLRFAVGDIASWRPGRKVDVIVSNAALHWVPDHSDLFTPWVGALAPGGWLALQVPANFSAPSHVILRELCESPRWRGQLGETIRTGAASPRPVAEPGEYLAILSSLGCRVDAWETTYQQVLPGADPVLEWVKGTALRPVLDVLGEDEAGEFLAEYGTRLREAYPPRPYGTCFPFRRLFVVAQKEGEETPGPPPGIAGLHHIQLAAPQGSEPAVREFYAGLLGLAEVPKPADLVARGGVWFRGPGLELHIGVERDFRPARKAHPGILVRDLDRMAERFRAAGREVRPDDLLPGYRRFYVDDPVGNRLEFLEPARCPSQRSGSSEEARAGRLVRGASGPGR